MRIKEISFSLERTMPLMPISKNSDDQYANVKPQASCTISFDADNAYESSSLDEKDITATRKLVQSAYEEAQRNVFKSIKDFSEELRDQYRKK